MRVNGKWYFHCLILALLLLALCGCGKSAESAEHSFFALDTYITMQATGPDAEAVLMAAEEQMQARDRQWWVTNPDSEIYAINHSDGNMVEVSLDTAKLVQFALDMSAQTNGALDPTLAVLVMRNAGMLMYFPFLLVSGCCAGAFTGLCAQLLLHRNPYMAGKACSQSDT